MRTKITEKQQQVKNFTEVRNFVWHRAPAGKAGLPIWLFWSQMFKFWLLHIWKWDRIRITGVDSGRIVHFSFGPRFGPESKICEKPDRNRSPFSISAVAGVCVVISYVKTCVNYGWVDDCSRSLNRSRILKFE